MQLKVDEWIKTIGVRYFSELTNMAILTEEVGEFARIVSRVYGEQSFKDPNDVLRSKELLEEELTDVLWVVLCLANQMDIDLANSFEKNMSKKTNRDQERHKSNKKLS